MNLYAKNEMVRLLEENGFFFKKKLGQNFLMNENTAARIAEASRETVPDGSPALALEIGPGAGALTLQLAKRFDRVLALEIDEHLIPVLKTSLAEEKKVQVECCDALKFPLESLAERYPGYHIAVCSNLPYYITSEAIMRLLESSIPLVSITVLIQKEAANRLCAKPGSPDYGAITASVSYYAESEKLFSVGPGNFIPRPQVDSTVLRLVPRSVPPVRPKDEKTFFQVIRAAFGARRKTLCNALSVYFSGRIPRDEILEILQSCGIPAERRGETLSLQEFCMISDAIDLREDVS